ncbi:MAG: NAD(P)(+) transhydrogenase (Re/Si-specific) subunit alpha, partial [Candidatus Margulisbacteria bacterium]|nr:NAD(P)(+) transhydrogenase (Re/Si-specific) subunit alpha [Candidatus Margulisiibacteriota bacterium]
MGFLLGLLKEIHSEEIRVPFIPLDVKKCVALGMNVGVETGIGTHCFFTDSQYKEAGATIMDRESILSQADVVIRLSKPEIQEINALKKEC